MTLPDYYDEELSDIIRKHIQNKKIPGFKLEKINLQLIGNIGE